VQFVIERDSPKQFRFASLQSPVAEKLLGEREVCFN
jgi:predicted DCC family thiol-disulfide oxidoreductase YuxK